MSVTRRVFPEAFKREAVDRVAAYQDRDPYSPSAFSAYR